MGLLLVLRLCFDDLIIDMVSTQTLTVSSSLDVNGNLLVKEISAINGPATILLAGNLTTQDTAVVGSGSITLDGSGVQTVSGSGIEAQISGLGISKTAGSVNVTSDIAVKGNLSGTGGTVDAASAGVVVLKGNTKTVNTAAVFDDIVIDMVSTQTVTVSSNFDVNGNLTIKEVGTINGPSGIFVAGNVVSNDASVTGSCVLTLDGSATTTLTGGDFPNGGIVVAKTGTASVILGASLTASAMTVNSGILDLNKKTLTISTNGTMTVNSAGTLRIYLDAVPLEQVVVNAGNWTFADGSTLLVDTSNVTVSRDLANPSVYDVGRVISDPDLIDNGMTITGTADASGNTPVFAREIVPAGVSNADRILRLTGNPGYHQNDPEQAVSYPTGTGYIDVSPLTGNVHVENPLDFRQRVPV